MFGVKIKKFATKKPYTLEELFDEIKDKQFTAGPVSYTKSGLAYVITFPPIDNNNQIWIMGSGLKGPFSKFTVSKNQVAGVGNAVKNQFISDLTGGWSRVSGVFGKNAKDTEKLVEITCEELIALDL